MYCRPEISRKIRYMSFFAAVSVVWLHTNPIGHIDGAVPCWVEVLGTWLSHFNDWAVPFFFVVSGFFFDRQCAESFRYGDIIRKKLHSLVIPYLFWGRVWGGLLWTPLWMLTNSRNGLPIFANTFLAEDNVLCAADFLVGVVCNGPANPVLWFMRVLIIVFLTAPLWIGLRRLSRWVLAGLALVGVFVFTPVSVVTPAEKLFSIYGCPFVLKCQGVAWFGVGMAVSAFRLEERRIHWSAAFVGWIGWWACWHFGLIRAFPFFIMLALWGSVDGLFRFLPQEVPAWMCTSFWIYCCHGPVCGWLGGISRALLGKSVAAYLVQVSTLWAMTIAFCLALAGLTRRYLPQVYNTLSGGR